MPLGICLKVNRRISGKTWLPVLSSDHWITLRVTCLIILCLCNTSLKLVKSFLSISRALFLILGKILTLHKHSQYLCSSNIYTGLFWTAADSGTFRLLTVAAWTSEDADGDFCDIVPLFSVAQKFFLASSFLRAWFLPPNLYWCLQSLIDSKLGRKCPETESTHQHTLHTEQLWRKPVSIGRGEQNTGKELM